ncbi:MAG TPA: hypothetical protein VH682_00915 [Gemmataceae bacterium]
MKLLVAMMIGFGAGLVAAGIVAIVSPFREPVHNIGIIGLGTGLLLGGVMALVILQRQK